MTNGEKIKQIFPGLQTDEGELEVYMWTTAHDAIDIPLEWWNAEYKEPEKSYVILTKEAYSDLCLRATTREDLDTAKTEIQKCIDVFAHSDNETGGYVQRGLEIALSILNKFVEVEG